jgi:putative transposase
VVDNDMILSPVGQIVAEEWQRTSEVRPNVTLDEWIVMPNHLHGILVISETPLRGVSTGDTRLAAGSLGVIVGQVKSMSTKRIREEGAADFGWQSRFYDHIVRSNESLQRIRRYIRSNPMKWAEDRYYYTCQR